MTPADKAAFVAKLRVESASIGGGCCQFSAFTPDMVCPVGIIWVTISGSEAPSAEILHCYTLPFMRRRGICSRITEAIFASGVETIFTSSGSDTGGMEWMKSEGFRFDRARRDWFLTRPKP